MTIPVTQDILAGHALIHAGRWSLPVFVAAPGDPWVQIHDEENTRDFSAQIPKEARPDPMGDAHLLVIDAAHRFVLEMYRARVFAHGHIVARRAFRVDLLGPGMFLHDGKFPACARWMPAGWAACCAPGKSARAPCIMR